MGNKIKPLRLPILYRVIQKHAHRISLQQVLLKLKHWYGNQADFAAVKDLRILDGGLPGCNLPSSLVAISVLLSEQNLHKKKSLTSVKTVKSLCRTLSIDRSI